MKPTTLRALAGLALALAAPLTHAHEGHGLPGANHWHGTDVWGFVAVAALAAATWHWFKGDK
jgi:hypothetical protein